MSLRGTDLMIPRMPAMSASHWYQRFCCLIRPYLYTATRIHIILIDFIGNRRAYVSLIPFEIETNLFL